MKAMRSVVSQQQSKAKLNCHRQHRQRRPLQNQRRLPHQDLRQRQNQFRSQVPRKFSWRKLLLNRRQKRTGNQRKRKKTLWQRRNPRLRAPVERRVQQEQVAVRAMEAAHRNSAGMATCYTTVFTAHGSSRLPTCPPAPKFRLWSKSASRRTGAFPNSKSSSRLKTLSSTNRLQQLRNKSPRLTRRQLV